MLTQLPPATPPRTFNVDVPEDRITWISASRAGNDVAEVIQIATGWRCKKLRGGCVVDGQEDVDTLDEVFAWLDRLGWDSLSFAATNLALPRPRS